MDSQPPKHARGEPPPAEDGATPKDKDDGCESGGSVGANAGRRPDHSGGKDAAFRAEAAAGRDAERGRDNSIRDSGGAALRFPAQPVRYRGASPARARYHEQKTEPAATTAPPAKPPPERPAPEQPRCADEFKGPVRRLYRTSGRTPYHCAEAEASGRAAQLMIRAPARSCEKS